jgi:preprotein translocase subunit SecB
MAETSDQGRGEAAAPGRTGAPAAPITVMAQYLKDLSFENPGVASAGGASVVAQSPQGRVDVDVRARTVGDNNYEVSLLMRAEAVRDGQAVFVAEIEYAGIFALNGIPQDAVEPVLLIECARLLFPFARAIVSQATQDGGYAPLLVNPIDFAQLYRAQRLRQSQAATA